VSTAANARYSGIDGRRSTRVDHPVTLIILGKNGLGQPFQEKTASVSVNLHGCRYPSRHEYPVGSWVGLQVVQADGQPRSPLMRAQVRSIHGAPREQFEVGVELETPANVWGVTTPPADWVRLTNGEHSTTHLASGGNLPREPQNQQSHGAQNGEVDSSKQSSTPKTERFVITSDQLILSVRPKLTQAAEQAIQSAIADKLDSAVRDALSKIDDVHRAGAREVADHSVQRFETLLRTSEEAILTHLEMRLSEMRSQWEEQQNAQKSHMQGISDQLDKIVAATRQVMGPDQQTSGKSAQSMMEPALLDGRIQARMDEYVNRATREFEASAARVSDRHLVRLMEDKQMVSREASAQIEARASEARASLHSAASEVVEEFRRQLETQVSTTIAEASQRASSALSSLDAESRSAIETRRRSLETDVTKAAEQSAEQFRTGIKAFLYSCLVAAVSAVDEHSQSTLEGLVKDAPKEGKENGHNGKLSHQFAITDDSSNKDREN
jgi:hypothetical protein